MTVLPSGCPCLSFGALSSLAVDAGAVGARRGRPLLGADMELRPGGGAMDQLCGEAGRAFQAARLFGPVLGAGTLETNPTSCLTVQLVVKPP